MADPVSTKPPRLLDRMREALRVPHYSYRTEQTYLDWARRFMLFHQKRHPAQMGAVEAGAFLTHLVAVRQVSASTQNQAKVALLFLYREVLGVDLPWLGEACVVRCINSEGVWRPTALRGRGGKAGPAAW